jgi:hypothetical protein
MARNSTNIVWPADNLIFQLLLINYNTPLISSQHIKYIYNNRFFQFLVNINLHHYSCAFYVIFLNKTHFLCGVMF